MDLTPRPPTQHPPNPNLWGILNAAIIFITSTVTRQTCSLQSLLAGTRGSTSNRADKQLTFIVHICVHFHILCAFPLTGWDLAMSKGRAQGLFHGVCRSISPLLLLNMSALFSWWISPPLPPTPQLQTRSKNALCWQHAAINSTVILCGWFSSNASLFIKWEN